MRGGRRPRRLIGVGEGDKEPSAEARRCPLARASLSAQADFRWLASESIAASILSTRMFARPFKQSTDRLQHQLYR